MSILASAGRKFLAMILAILFLPLIIIGSLVAMFGYGIIGVSLILLGLFAVAAAFALWHH